MIEPVGTDHQHRFDHFQSRVLPCRRLCQLEAWTAGSHPRAGVGNGAYGNNRERDLSGLSR
jgi:hypothetical protein